MRKKRKSERLEWQLRFAVDPRRFKTAKARREAVDRARRHFIRTGSEIVGVRIMARWRNPDNKNPLHSNWKTTEDEDQTLEDFFLTLKGAIRS